MSFIINPYRHAGGGGATNGLLTGLQSYWKLDEASGTIADSHGSNDGTLTGATYGATGVINDCIGFDGTGDYISMGDVLDFNYNEPFSVSCWFNLNTDTSNLEIVSKRDGSSGTGYTILRSSSANSYQLRFVLQDTGAGQIIVDSVSGYSTTSTWYHLVCTYDGSGSASGVTMYVDGSSISVSTVTDTLSTTTTNAIDFNIGNRDSGNSPDNSFNGEIDEVGIWSRELSSTDVMNLYNSGSGLAYGDFTYSGEGLLTSLESYYKLDEASGTAAYDAHGSNDGAITGATINQTGIIDKCYDFDGAGDYVDCGDVSAFEFERTTPFSIAAWFKAATINTGPHSIVSKQSHTTGDGWNFYRHGSSGNYRLYFNMTDAGVGQILRSTTSSYNSTDWFHFVITYDGGGAASGVNFYVDGSLASMTTITDNLTTTIGSNAYKVNIGGRNNNNLIMNGLLDEVGIWSKELTALEVLNLYKGGAGMPYSEFTS